VSTEPFVPDDFDPPRELERPEFLLVPLGAEHNESDHAAWTGSIEHVRSTPGFQGSWPPVDGMSLERNLEDLQRHADDFSQRRGFTFTVLERGTGEVIGCVYIYAARDDSTVVDVHSWVRADRADLDKPLYDAVSRWLSTDWPFADIRYAPRPPAGA